MADCCAECKNGSGPCKSGVLKAMSAEQLTAIKTRIETVASAKKINLETVTMTETTPSTAPAAITASADITNMTAPKVATPGVAVPAMPTEDVGSPAEVAPAKATVDPVNVAVATPGEAVPALKVEVPGADSQTVPIAKYLEASKMVEALTKQNADAIAQIADMNAKKLVLAGEIEKKNVLVQALMQALTVYVPQQFMTQDTLKAASAFIPGIDPTKKLVEQNPEDALKFVAFSAKLSEVAASAGAGAVETDETKVKNTKAKKEITFDGLTIKNKKPKVN